MIVALKATSGKLDYVILKTQKSLRRQRNEKGTNGACFHP